MNIGTPSFGVTQYLLSAHEQRALTEALTLFEIAGYFHEIVGQSDRYSAGKVGAGLALIERLDLERSRTLLIGDTLHDHEVALALGVDCLLVCNGHHSRRRLEAVHDKVIDSLAVLRERT